ncbi:PLxRFG domain-containing protein [Cupriavidus taiwanensis]|uniref:PLxRFG domain-containing protein n=1 Tax=Cupriavidus taiwanensis TaxID=164546 RepID=UPI0015717638|nr:PLxRFG domain-containing protein [Cupriavidus taiwanensis]NSX14941.1 PLxRFG domain-containing protein [Cupriavidus taiwanensis]
MALQDFGSLSLSNTPTGAQTKAPGATGQRRARTTPLDAATIDRILAEEGAAAVRPTVLGIYGQESSGGTNARTSIDGARGGMQVMPDTFDRLAKPGERIDSPEDNFRVGVRYLKRMADQFGNDPARLAVGYFSGEGNVNTKGDTPYKEDRRDGNGKLVSSYVRDLVGRVGNAVVPEAKAATSTPDLSKAPKYRDFIAKPQWAGLDDAQKDQARNAYFDRYVAPHLPAAQRDGQRDAFLRRAAEIEGPAPAAPEQPGLLSRAASAINAGLKSVLPAGGEAGGDPMGAGAAEIAAAGAAPAPSKIGVMGTAPVPVSPNDSRAPVTPEFRAQVNRAYDAATPAEREQMAKVDGVVGQLVRERAGIKGASTETGRRFDTTAEGRESRMRADGVDPTAARNFAQYGAAAGQTPGTELGTAGASNFDFEAQKAFGAGPLSNPVIRAAVKGYEGYRAGSLGLAQALFDATGNEEFADIARGGIEASQRRTAAIGEKGDGLQRNFEGAVSSIAQQLPALLAGVATGTQVVPLATMFTQTFGQEYGQGRAQGLDGAQAAARAGIFGAFEVLGERFGLGQTLQALKMAGRGAATQDIATVLARGILKEIPGEQLTTLGQFLTDKVPGVGTNLEAGLAEYLQQAGDTLAQTVMQGGLMMGGTTGVAAGVRHLQGAPTQQTQVLAADQARENALTKAAAFGQPVRAKHASEAAADQVVREMAAEAGMDIADLLPQQSAAPAVAPAPTAATAPVQPPAPLTTGEPAAAAAPVPAPAAPQPAAYDPRQVLDFAQTRYERLLAKRDGEAVMESGADGMPVDVETAGQELTPEEQQEISVLEQSRGDVAALARYYGFDEDDSDGSAQQPDDVGGRSAAPDAAMAGDPATGRADAAPAGEVGEGAPRSEVAAVDGGAVPGADGAADGQPTLSEPAAAVDQPQDDVAIVGPASAQFDPPDMTDEQLRERADYIRQQARANGGWTKMATGERDRVDAEIARRAAAQTAAAEGKPDTAQVVDAAAQEAATSPQNDLPEPTDAQKEAGNYKLGHVSLHGLDVSIENPRGSTRSGTAPDGSAWSVEMANHYGYFKRTEGADGDHVDVFIGPHPDSTKVFVVDQVDPATGRFDEHKVLMGFNSLAAARAGYLANYEKGWKGAGAITAMSLGEFKAWLKDGDTTKPLDQKVGKPRTEKQAKAARANAKAAEQPASTPKKKTEKQLRAERGAAAKQKEAAAEPPRGSMPAPTISTNAEAFKRWFGDSKVRADGGAPMVMYHGTSASQAGEAFTSFDTLASNYGLMGMGGYFTADPTVASSYTRKGKGGSPTVYPVYLSIKNPIDMDAKADVEAWKRQFDGIEEYHEGGDTNESWYRAAEESLVDQELPKWEGAEIMQDALRAMGYDGITHIGGGRVDADGARHRVFIAFDPEQIKSAIGNRGTFDAASPELVMSRRRADDGKLQANDLRGRFALVVQKWTNGPKGGVEVVQSVGDLPERLASFLRSNGEDGRVEGFYLPKSDKVYLIADNLPSAARAQEVVFHEVYGHKGLRAILPGEQYADMMDRIRRANPKIARAADAWYEQYGLDTVMMNRDAGQSNAEAVRNAELLAVEEALADMAATEPVAGPVRKLLDAVQRALRAIGLDSAADWLEGRSQAETFALLRDARAAVFGVTRNGETHVMTANAATAAPAFSRARDSAQMNLFRLLSRDSKEGSVDTISAWDKTVGTQYNKALKDEHFGRVFGYALAMQNEVSMASVRPAELAPALLPKVDAFGTALRQFVLGRRRDKEMVGATQAIFAGTTAGDTVAQGKVWTDEELQGLFGLTGRGIKLYRQARAAINASLDEVAAAEAYAMAQGFVPKDLRQTVMHDPSGARGALLKAIDQQTQMLERATKKGSLAKSAADRAEAVESALKPYTETRQKVEEIFDRADQLKGAGYAPLMRFGKYTVYANEVGPNGEVLRDEDDQPKTLYFGIFETEAEAIRAADKLRARYADHGDVRVTRGKKDQKGHELFTGISPETVALFGDVIGKDEATQKFYQQALSERSALKRRLGRRAVEGYSNDLPRVLANFITSNGRFAAQRYYLRDLNNAIRSVPKSKGDVKDEAITLRNYLMDANDGGAGASTLMFAYFLGGSVASAVVNLSQPFMMTGPYLSQWGAGRAAAAMAKALPYALGKKQIADQGLREALKRANQEGIVEAQEIFHLYSQGAQGVSAALARRLASIPRVGAKLGESTESMRARMEGFMTLWGMMFAAAESFNRKLTFASAWELATATDRADPYAFAVRAVNETQGIFAKVNRPNWARSTPGRLLMTFKQYSIMYLELTRRMWRAGPQGKKAVLMMMAVLLLASGEEGLPFAQDIADLVDTIGQALGYDTNLLRDKRKWAHQILGQTAGDFALYGISSMLPLDFAGRVGLGNLIPGTGLLKPAESKDRTREITDVIGPAGALVSAGMDSYDAWTAKQPGRAVMAVMPKAIGNAAAGIEMAMTDKAVDYKGRKVTDVGLAESVVKGLGFTPTKVAEDTRRRMPARQDIALVQKTQADILDLWTRGLSERNQGMQERAAAWLKDWNEKNPESPILITNKQLQSRVKQMATPSADRMLKNAPKGLRSRLAGQLAAGQEEGGE